MKNESIHTIPLRTSFVKVPKHRRAKRAISTIKDYVTRHMKTDNVKLGKELNEKVWGNGIKNPPGKVTVKAIRHDDFVSVELEGFDYKVEKVQTKKEEPKTLKDKLEAKMGTKEADKKAESKSEVKSVKAKKEVNSEEKAPEPAKSAKEEVKAETVVKDVKAEEKTASN
ncbi:60S ribosomal protein L31 [Candidatus Woesearchaeota archaeon]|nr:60S ribosomal protein L31 [Candidatus Woesearchaeota archaeon]MCF7901732.1 60S ribosomal protein L31 [Candidatus Woesearchaeota archaeon]MCF8013631.1 60S ribosomal protein L31 [Candidatus Woesearchaeota archaeon]